MCIRDRYKEENKTADVSQFRATLTDNDIK